jgi:AhpD family alkylhydroperoxidase
MAELRLPSIERPRQWWLRLAYWMSRRRFRRVITPLKIIYARQPALLTVAAHIDWVRDHKISIEPSLRLLVSIRASMLNRCAFCHDLALAQAVEHRIGPERFAALDEAQTNDPFTERERAALALVDEVTRDGELTTPTFERLTRSFTETEIVELMWLNAVENYFNLQAHPLGIGSDGLRAVAQGETRGG